MTKSVTIDVLIVTHNSAGAIEGCLESLRFVGDVDWADIAISIVDNFSDDDTVAVITAFQERYPELKIRVSSLAFNPGWGEGNNIAADAWCRDSDFILFYNPDTSISESGLRYMVDALVSSDASVAGVVPFVTDNLGRHVSALPDLSMPRILFRDIGAWRFYRRRLFRSYDRKVAASYDVVELVGGYPCGAMFLVRRQAFELAGRCDPGIFLYFDDADFARRVMASGLRVLVHPRATAFHLGGKGSAVEGEDSFGTKRETLLYEAELAYVEKWYGTSVARGIARFRVWPYFQIRNAAQFVRRRPLIPYESQKNVFRRYLESSSPVGSSKRQSA